jgi:hypothetical protein
MSLDNLANMFSQKSGVQQSIASTVMSTIMGYMMQHFMQKGLSGFLGSGGKDQNSMKSALSQLQNQTNDPNHELVQQVKNNSGLQDDNQAKQYTQQAVNIMHEHITNNPQEVHSAFENVADSKGFDLGGILRGLTEKGGSEGQVQKKQGIGDLLGF